MNSPIVRYCVSILALSLIGGCTSAPVDSPSQSPVTQPVTKSPTAGNTTTPVPSSTHLSIVHTGSAPPLQTASNTQTMMPTFSREEVDSRIKELLSNNGSCRLPCLWGITPGVNTHQEAEAVLSLVKTPTVMDKVDHYDLIYLEHLIKLDDLEISVDISIVSDHYSGVISYMVFKGRSFLRKFDEIYSENGYVVDTYQSGLFGEMFQLYRMDSILVHYGLPQSVMIRTAPEIPEINTYRLFNVLLLYPDRGLSILYTTHKQVRGTAILGCMENAHVEMELHPQGDPGAFYKSLSSHKWEAKGYNGFKQLEDATDLTILDFYERFQADPAQCLVTQAEAWISEE